jgi:hypothetical protein
MLVAQGGDTDHQTPEVSGNSEGSGTLPHDVTRKEHMHGMSGTLDGPRI